MDDADAFARFYTANHGSVLVAVRATLGEAQLAKDAVDEAFVRAAERWSTVRDAQRPAAWTYRVAVNWATSWRRKWSLRPTRPVDQLDRSHEDTLPDVDLAGQLAALPLEQRQALILRYVLGLSVRETASVLGVAEGTVKSSVHRARQRLRDDALATEAATQVDHPPATQVDHPPATQVDHPPATQVDHPPATQVDDRDTQEVFDGRA